MTGKPSYLGLLNSIAVNEAENEELYCTWAAVTSRPDVKAVLESVMVREGEHAKSFAKRINELGFSVRTRDTADHAARMAIASSTTVADCEKFEQLNIGIAPSGTDIFARFMDDMTIDIHTGELIGRFIAEERDSIRMLHSCRVAVSAPAPGSHGTTAIEARLDRIESALAQLLASKA